MKMNRKSNKISNFHSSLSLSCSQQCRRPSSRHQTTFLTCTKSMFYRDPPKWKMCQRQHWTSQASWGELFAVYLNCFHSFHFNQSISDVREWISLSLSAKSRPPVKLSGWGRTRAHVDMCAGRRNIIRKKKLSRHIILTFFFFFAIAMSNIFISFLFFFFRLFLFFALSRLVVVLLDSSMEVLTSSSTYFSISEPKAKLMTRYSREMTLINSDSSDLTKKKVRSSWILFIYFFILFAERNTHSAKRRIEFMAEMEISADEEKKKAFLSFQLRSFPHSSMS